MKITFRSPKISDLDLLLNHINDASQEQTYIRKQKGKVTKEEEESYLKGRLKEIQEGKTVMLMAFDEDVLVGTSDIKSGFGAEKHVGIFGIVIKKEYRNKGIGTKLIKKVIDEAVNSIDGLEIITLGVFSDNNRGVHLYKKFGFKEYGKLPRGIIRKEKYSDHVYMYLDVRKIA